MQYRTLGRTGVQVSSLALGAMNFGQIGRTGQDEATALVDAALEAGINLIDTADRNAHSVVVVGTALKGRRHDIVLVDAAAGRQLRRTGSLLQFGAPDKRGIPVNLPSHRAQPWSDPRRSQFGGPR